MLKGTPGVAQMSVSELKHRIDRGEPIALLDVREHEERAYCAIPLPGSLADLHVPMNQIPARLEALRAVAESTPLIVYCHLGMRSMSAARWLESRGVPNVHNLEGGIDAWSNLDPAVRRY